jgi:hypothetical protein
VIGVNKSIFFKKNLFQNCKISKRQVKYNFISIIIRITLIVCDLNFDQFSFCISFCIETIVETKINRILTV